MPAHDFEIEEAMPTRIQALLPTHAGAVWSIAATRKVPAMM